MTNVPGPLPTSVDSGKGSGRETMAMALSLVPALDDPHLSVSGMPPVLSLLRLQRVLVRAPGDDEPEEGAVGVRNGVAAAEAGVRGLADKYGRFRPLTDQEAEASFWTRVEKTEGCWLWTGPLNSNGYGRFYRSGKMLLAHRYAYERLVGPLAQGEQLDHDRRCPKRCVRPDPHWSDSPGLRVATQKQNMENLVGPHPTNRSSGIRGVHWHSHSGKWFVRVKHEGVVYSGGYFTDIEDAQGAAISLRNKLFTHNDADRVTSL